MPLPLYKDMYLLRYLADQSLRLATFLEHFPLGIAHNGGLTVGVLDNGRMDALPRFLSYESNRTRECIDADPYNQQEEQRYRELIEKGDIEIAMAAVAGPVAPVTPPQEEIIDVDVAWPSPASP